MNGPFSTAADSTKSRKRSETLPAVRIVSGAALQVLSAVSVVVFPSVHFSGQLFRQNVDKGSGSFNRNMA